MPDQEKKTKILNAAEQVMSVKGLIHSSISEIAEIAEVQESAIYQYFKGKEDLLFSVTNVRLKEALKLLYEQLEGIEDPASRLRKMIWFNLHYNDTHKKYARLLLMECRYSKSFYQHQAYSYVRQYVGNLLSILNNGVNKKVFRSDVNMRIVRDMIFGLLDWEKVSCFAIQEIEETIQDFEKIISLILPMITLQKSRKKVEPGKADRLLQAANTVFAEKGYFHTTMSEIAQKANVADGTIYEYFKNKEDLLFSIPKIHFEKHIENLYEIFHIKTPLRKLRRFIRYHFLLHLNDREFLSVFLLNIQFNAQFYKSPVYETFSNYIGILDNILEEGKKDGSIRSNIDNRVFRNLFLGTFSHISIRWFILGGKGKVDKMKELDEVVALLSRAVASKIED
ncbi:MAG: TetR/AcrR family transcriptional regulator [Bacteroidetes bacterium]|nr:TetR/AcrR family transcriptional regulator [Bacteroidota bacterium]